MDLKYKDITEKVIGAAMKVHSTLGNGFQEIIYQRAMAIQMRLDNISFIRECNMPIFYLEHHIGDRRVDFFVEDKICVELKALINLEPVHFTQSRNYLEAFNVEVGLLLNFGAISLQFKRLSNPKFNQSLIYPKIQIILQNHSSDNMKKILQYLFEYKTLPYDQAKEILINISKGIYNETEVTAFVTVFLMRSITIEELQGFRDALLELCVKVDLADYKTIDIVGTGGDGKNTFNISTLACFIVAGTGQKVAKHGNYGATSISGSSNVMEQLGYKFKNDQQQLKKEIEEANICFMHAPLFHPALKTVAPIRKNLGLRTFFNMLGPMVNPASPEYQLVGVYNLEMARIYNYLLQQTGKSFTIIHSLDGYDEISLTNDTKVITKAGDKIKTPVELGKRFVEPESIYGGNTTEEAAKIFKKIIQGEGTWAQNAVVLANAAMALHCTGTYKNYDDAYGAAVESLDGGKANDILKRLISIQ